MKKSLLFLIVLSISSCGQGYNSNFNDSGTYANLEGIDADLQDSYVIMQTKCFSCHAYQDLKTSQSWIDAGNVVAGNPGASKIFYRLIGQPGGDMPKSPITALSSDEVETLRTWINGI